MTTLYTYLSDPTTLLSWAKKLVDDLNKYSARGKGLLAGMRTEWHSATPPDGWLLCDGSSHTLVSQPVLFATIGYTYGGSGANFNVPPATSGVAHTIIKA